MANFSFPGSSGSGWMGEGEVSSGGGCEVGKISVENVERGQQGYIWEGSTYTVLKCLNSTCLKNDRKPEKDLSLS